MTKIEKACMRLYMKKHGFNDPEIKNDDFIFVFYSTSGFQIFMIHVLFVKIWKKIGKILGIYKILDWMVKK